MKIMKTSFWKQLKCDHSYHEVYRDQFSDSTGEVILFCHLCGKEKNIKKYQLEKLKKEIDLIKQYREK